mmetsp:Transcript_48535/g.147648  ORF Transcript_48535/g.147648 Transcript_48535/m.147648 type:complete len:260 (+) Transcript_48535:1338-2117(+)
MRGCVGDMGCRLHCGRCVHHMRRCGLHCWRGSICDRGASVRDLRLRCVHDWRTHLVLGRVSRGRVSDWRRRLGCRRRVGNRQRRGLHSRPTSVRDLWRRIRDLWRCYVRHDRWLGHGRRSRVADLRRRLCSVSRSVSERRRRGPMGRCLRVRSVRQRCAVRHRRRRRELRHPADRNRLLWEVTHLGLPPGCRGGVWGGVAERSAEGVGRHGAGGGRWRRGELRERRCSAPCGVLHGLLELDGGRHRNWRVFLSPRRWTT